MRGDQLARQWRILRTIESKKQGATVAELAAQEGCHPRTIWRDLAAIEPARLTSLLQSDQVRYSPRQLETQAGTGNSQLATDAMTMEVGGLVEVMSWVMAWRPSQGFQFWHRSRKARILPTGILRVFRARKSECDADMGQKRMFCDGLAWEACLGVGTGLLKQYSHNARYEALSRNTKSTALSSPMKRLLNHPPISGRRWQKSLRPRRGNMLKNPNLCMKRILNEGQLDTRF